MSIIERIREIQQVQTQQATRIRVEENVAAEKEKLAKEERERPMQEAVEKKRKFIDQVLEESGTLICLTKIKDELLVDGIDPKDPDAPYIASGYVSTVDNVRFKKLVIDYKQGSLKLLWGSVSTMNDGRGYLFISVNVNPDNETLTIGNKLFQRQEWTDKELVERVIAEAYLNPERKPSYDSSYDRGWGIDGGIGGVN